MIMRVEAVLAINKKRVLGDRGALPWRAPRDMRHFRELTTGNIVVMGRKTYEAIGRVLPGRENMVVTRRPDRLAHVPELVAVPSVEAAIARYPADEARTCYVIGGAQIFEAALPYIERVHLTVIDDAHEGDVVLEAFEHLFIEREVQVFEAIDEPRQIFKLLERIL